MVSLKRGYRQIGLSTVKYSMDSFNVKQFFKKSKSRDLERAIMRAIMRSECTVATLPLAT
jgi:hypothetical protein